MQTQLHDDTLTEEQRATAAQADDVSPGASPFMRGELDPRDRPSNGPDDDGEDGDEGDDDDNDDDDDTDDTDDTPGLLASHRTRP